MKIDLSYHYLTHHVVPGPQSFSYFLAFILLLTALHIPRSVLSRWQNICVFKPAITIATVHAWYAMAGVDVISADLLFQSLFFLVLHDPWTSFEHITARTAEGKPESREERLDQVETDGSEVLLDSEQTPLASENFDTPPRALHRQGYPSTLRERIPWVMMLFSSIRLNTWTIGHKSHDAAQPPPPAFRTRRLFFAQAVLSIVRGFLVLDLTRAYVSYDPYFTDTSVSIASELELGNWRIFPAHLIRSMVIGAQAWALISQMFFLPCMAVVALNACGVIPDIWSPHNWAPFFGPASTIFTHGVRGLWGGYWHQTMRWMTSAPGYSISEALNLPRKAASRYTLISTSAFLLSGFTHMGLVPPEPLHATVSTNYIRLCVAGFFWLQPVAMIMEVIVANVRRRFASPAWLSCRRALHWRYAVNGLWVVMWFSLCLPLLGEAGRQMGYWRVWPMPVSLWRGLRGEGWVTWPFLES